MARIIFVCHRGYDSYYDAKYKKGYVAHKYYSEKQNLGPISNLQNSLFHGKE